MNLDELIAAIPASHETAEEVGAIKKCLQEIERRLNIIESDARIAAAMGKDKPAPATPDKTPDIYLTDDNLMRQRQQSALIGDRADLLTAARLLAAEAKAWRDYHDFIRAGGTDSRESANLHDRIGVARNEITTNPLARALLEEAGKEKPNARRA